MAINSGKLVAGAVVAGIVANALDYVWNQILLKAELEAWTQRLNLDPAAANNPVPWIIVNFIWGFLLVLTYVGFRARWGPGPKTAMYAGLVLFLGVCSVLYGFMSMGLFSVDTYMKSAALSLVSTMCASLAGAWVYKET